MSEKKEDGLDFKRLLPVLFVVLVDVMGITIIIPILPFYAIAFNANTTTIGLLLAVYPLMQFVFGPMLGALSDRIGRKPVLATAQVGTFLSLLTLGFAGSLWMIFVSRIIDGITGANLSTAQSVITDSTSTKNRSAGLGLIGATFGVGFVLGPALSGIALRLSGNNYSAPAFLAAAFAFTSILLTTFVLKETHPPEKRGVREARRRNFGRLFYALKNPKLNILFILAFLLQVIFGSFQATFAPFTLSLLGLNSLGNAIFFTSFGVILAVVQGGMVGPLTRRFGERKLIYAGLLLFSLGFLLSSFTPRQPVPWYSRTDLIDELSQQTGEDVDTILDSSQLDLLPADENKGWGSVIFLLIVLTPLPIGIALVQPNVGSLVTKRSDPQRIGEALGISASFTALGSIVGPLSGGLIFDLFGPNRLYLISGLSGLVLFGIVLRYLQPLPEEDAALNEAPPP